MAQKSASVVIEGGCRHRSFGACEDLILGANKFRRRFAQSHSHLGVFSTDSKNEELVFKASESSQLTHPPLIANGIYACGPFYGPRATDRPRLLFRNLFSLAI